MANQNPNSSGLLWFLEAGNFFLQEENVDKKWRGVWSYSQITDLLRESAVNFDPDLEKAGMEKLVPFLTDLFAREEDKDALMSRVPYLGQLLKEAELAKEKSALLQKRVLEKIDAVIEAKQKHVKYSGFVEKMKAAAITRLTEAKVSEPQINDFANAVIAHVKIDEVLVIDAGKTAELPQTPNKTIEEAKVDTRLKRVWEEAVDNTTRDLQSRGRSFSPEQIKFLKENPPEKPTLLSLSQKTEPAFNKAVVVNEIRSALLPLLPLQEAKTLVEIIIEPVLVTSLQEEIPLTQKQFDRLSEEDKVLVMDKASRDIEKAVVDAIGINIEEIAKKVPIPPEMVPKLLRAFSPRTTEEFKATYFPLLASEKDEREQVVFLTNPSTPILDSNTNALPQNTRGLRFSGSTQQNALRIVDYKKIENDQGVSFIDEIKKDLARTGINRSTVSLFTSKYAEHQAALLTIFGVSPKDFEHTIEILKQKGFRADTPAIKELQRAQENLIRFQQTNRFSLKQIIEWQEERVKAWKKDGLLIGLPDSKIPLAILSREKLPPPTRFNGLVRKIFGEKVVIFQNQVLYINRFSAFNQGIALKIRKYFYRTSFGRGIKLGLQRSNIAALRGFWTTASGGVAKRLVGSAAKFGFQIAAKLGLKGLLAFAGTALTALTGPIGLLVGIVAPKLIGRLLKGFSSVLGFIPRLFGLGGQQGDGNFGKILVAVIVGPIALVVLVIILLAGPITTALLSGGSDISSIPTDFNVTKTVSPQQIDNTSPPYVFDYTISITALDKRLTNITLKEEFSVFQNGAKSTISVNPVPPLPSSIDVIESRETKSFFYKITINQNLKDALIINELTVNAYLEGSSDLKEVKTSAVATIGNATGCFAFTGPWSASDQMLELGAISKLLTFPKYAGRLCSGSSEKIILNRVPENDWCWVERPNKINITDRCLGNAEYALYGLAHESGHIFVLRSIENNNLYVSFVQNVLGPLGEDYLCSYPLIKSPGEDFPETIAVYVTNQFYINHSYSVCGGPLNLSVQYPKHYSFIKSQLF